MNVHSLNQPDLDAIARNLSYLDLAHLTPEESTAYEHELSAIASLNEALETATEALKGNHLPVLVPALPHALRCRRPPQQPARAPARPQRRTQLSDHRITP